MTPENLAPRFCPTPPVLSRPQALWRRRMSGVGRRFWSEGETSRGRQQRGVRHTAVLKPRP
jgi:hypothetical protein